MIVPIIMPAYDIYLDLTSCFNCECLFLSSSRPIRGMGAVVAGAGPAHAFYFGIYEHSKELLDKANVNHQVSYGMTTLNFFFFLFLTNLLPLIIMTLICLFCCVFSIISHVSRYSNTYSRRYLKSNRGDQATTTDVQFTVQVGGALCSDGVQNGRNGGFLSLIRDTIVYECALSGNSLFDL